jgi:iron complex outermembrane receptor protein
MMRCAFAVSSFALVAILAGQAAAQERPATAPGAPSTPPATTPAAPEGAAPATGDAPDQGNAIGDDIVVTARKRSERLLDVPVSVTALTSQTLTQQNILGVRNLSAIVPNLTVSETAGSSAVAVFTIRGLTQLSANSTLDPAVGVYMDGVYLSRAYGANSDLVDISSVEVLKGPQGTLFGRNTTGGAILINTNDPKMNQTSGNFEVTVGNYAQRNFAGVFNTTLVSDILAIRIAAKSIHNDGFGRDTLHDLPLGNKGTTDLRAKLLFTPTSRFNVLLSADHFDLDEGNKPVRIGFLVAGGNAQKEILAESGGTDNGTSALTVDPYNHGLDYYPQQIAHVTTLTGKAHWDLFADTSLEAILSHRVVDSFSKGDLDGTKYAVLQTNVGIDWHQDSAELRLTGKALDRRLDYTVGLYYFGEGGLDFSTSQTTPLINANNPNILTNRLSNWSKAIYGQLTFKLTPTLSFTAGARYGVDRKQINYELYLRSVSLANCQVPVVLRQDPDVCSGKFAFKENSTPFTFAAQWKPAPDNMLYASVTRGFLGGGFNARPVAGATTAVPFKAEQVTSYEVGSKNSFLGGRVTFNLAAYYSDYSNIQKSEVVPNSSGGVATYTINAASARIYGGEAELSVMPFEGLRLYGNLGITNARYNKFIDYRRNATTGVITPLDRSAEVFEGVPDYSYSVGASYRRATGVGDFNANLTWSFTDDLAYGLNAIDSPGYGAPTTQKAYGLLNGRISFDLKNGLGVAVYGTNLLDKRYDVFALDQTSSGLGYVLRSSGPPRQYGAMLSYRF